MSLPELPCVEHGIVSVEFHDFYDELYVDNPDEQHGGYAIGSSLTSDQWREIAKAILMMADRVDERGRVTT